MTATGSVPEGPGPGDDVDPDVPLYRLVPTKQCDVVAGHWQFQSAAFDNASVQTPGEHPDDMSVAMGDTLESHDREPETLPNSMEIPDDWGVAVLLARHVLVEEQEIRRTPTQVEPAHGDVRGKKGGPRRRRLKKQARWVVPPSAPPPL